MSARAVAGIRLSDEVNTIKKCRLSAVTTGRFFPAGGKLVTFYIDGHKTGTTMSGGDGYAFMKCTGVKKGLHRIRSASGEESAEAYLLLAGEAMKILLIHIDAVLMGSLFRSGKDDLKPSALEGLDIVYVTSLPSVRIVHKLLLEQGYPAGPVLEWADGAAIRELLDKGVNIHAIVAPAVLLGAIEGVRKKFSFEDAGDNAEVIKNWDDLRKKW